MLHHTTPAPRATDRPDDPGTTPDAAPDAAPGARGPGRRSVVRLAGAAALGAVGAAGLAACSSGSSSGGTAGNGGGGAASSGAASSGAPSGTGASGSGAAAGATLAALADVPVGGALIAAGADGKPVVLTQPSAGQVVAFSALCPHQGCKVLVENRRLDCPCHGSRFDLAGKVLQGPARADLPPVAVTVRGTDVVAG